MGPTPCVVWDETRGNLNEPRDLWILNIRAIVGVVEDLFNGSFD